MNDHEHFDICKDFRNFLKALNDCAFKKDVDQIIRNSESLKRLKRYTCYPNPPGITTRKEKKFYSLCCCGKLEGDDK